MALAFVSSTVELTEGADEPPSTSAYLRSDADR